VLLELVRLAVYLPMHYFFHIMPCHFGQIKYISMYVDGCLTSG